MTTQNCMLPLEGLREDVARLLHILTAGPRSHAEARLSYSLHSNAGEPSYDGSASVPINYNPVDFSMPESPHQVICHQSPLPDKFGHRQWEVVSDLPLTAEANADNRHQLSDALPHPCSFDGCGGSDSGSNNDSRDESDSHRRPPPWTAAQPTWSPSLIAPLNSRQASSTLKSSGTANDPLIVEASSDDDNDDAGLSSPTYSPIHSCSCSFGGTISETHKLDDAGNDADPGPP